MAKDAKPSNGFDGKKLKGFVDRIANRKDEIKSVMGTAMRECKSIREDIKEIYSEAKDAGVPVAALKAEVKLRELDAEKEKVVAGLEAEDADSLEMIREALGDYASLPLGRAAVDAAEARGVH